MENTFEGIEKPPLYNPLQAPPSELLEKALNDPRVQYIPSAKQLDFSQQGGLVFDAAQYYQEWKGGGVESHKAGIHTFRAFVTPEVTKTLQKDLAGHFPVAVRGIALNIGETIHKGQPNEVLGVSEVVALGTERRERTGDRIPTLVYEAGEDFPSRSEQWLLEAPTQLRALLPEYKDQIFPAVLVYKKTGINKKELLKVYIVDHLSEQEEK